MEPGLSASNQSSATRMPLLLFVYNVIVACIEALARLLRPTRKKSIQGQIVLITGAGHGLGRELAIEFARNCANLALVDVNETNNQLVKQELEDRFGGLKIKAYSADIKNETEVVAVAARVREDFGDIDILVNNAGILQCLPLLQLESKLIEQTFQVNVLAHFWLIKQFLPGMLAKQRGHIVAISSMAGLIGNKYLTDYCASKFAIIGLMDSLDHEIHEGEANKDIHLTTVCPATISTGMLRNPTSRFNWILPILEAQQVATCVVDAVLVNKPLVVVPPMALVLHRISSILPTRVRYLMQEFLGYGARPHRA